MKKYRVVVEQRNVFYEEAETAEDIQPRLHITRTLHFRRDYD